MHRRLFLSSSAATLLLAAHTAAAANFLNAMYDSDADQLIVTLAYRGTHADHRFSLAWGECRRSAEHAGYEIAGRVLDAQWDDLAREPFTKTIHFPLDGLPCRPATVTLVTEPDFRIGVFVPEKPEG